MLSAAKRIQLNLQLVECTYLPEIEKIRPETMLPIFYASEQGGVTESLANEFKEKVYDTEYGLLGGIFGLIGLLGELVRGRQLQPSSVPRCVNGFSNV